MPVLPTHGCLFEFAFSSMENLVFAICPELDPTIPVSANAHEKLCPATHFIVQALGHHCVLWTTVMLVLLGEK